MGLTKEYVEKVFKPLAEGKTSEFFEVVAEDVRWTVLGTHPLAGDYQNKADFINNTFRRLGKVMTSGVHLKVDSVLIDGNQATVELVGHATAKNGHAFNNRYCWIVTFANGIIKEVRAYLDSALVNEVITENEQALLQSQIPHPSLVRAPTVAETTPP